MGGERARLRAVDLTEPAHVSAFAREGDEPVGVIVNAAGGIDRRDDADLADLAERWLADYRMNVLTAMLFTGSAPGGRRTSRP